MSTIQVERRLKKELFAVAADLQKRLGRNVSLNDAIDHLIRSFRGEGRDVDSLLSLFGTIGPSREPRRTLKALRKDGKLERIARKYDA